MSNVHPQIQAIVDEAVEAAVQAVISSSEGVLSGLHPEVVKLAAYDRLSSSMRERSIEEAQSSAVAAVAAGIGARSVVLHTAADLTGTSRQAIEAKIKSIKAGKS